MAKQELYDTINNAINHAISNLHTATIARVTTVNASTINCQPVTNRLVDGKSIKLPVFTDVPIITLQGGGSYQAFPIAVGDYALLFFTERCFDGWYNGQDEVSPLEHRMFDYSDGLALVGINNMLSSIEIPSVIKQQGDTEQIGDYEHTGDRTQTGNFTLLGNFSQTGGPGGGSSTMTNVNITITTGDIVADGISLKNHTHPGVQAGTDDTGAAQ